MSEAYIIGAGGTGFLVGFGLIFSIGPQNLQLIRAGALDQSPLLVASIGYISEFALVLTGLLLVGAITHMLPAIENGLRILGVGLLIRCGLNSMLRRETAVPSLSPETETRRQALLTMLAVTWLNPLVYVEIMFLTGAVGSSLERELRPWFADGFLLASALRFYGWPLVGKVLRNWLATAQNQRIFDVTAGAFLLTSAALLARQLLFLQQHPTP